MTRLKEKAWPRFLLLPLLLLLGSIFALTLEPMPAAALEVPSLTAGVNDYAGMLSPATVQQLESVLAALETKESTQLAVLTITSLEGESLENFSLKVVEKWKLGQKGLDNGTLLLIAKDDRKIRIEVGYGLEGVLTDLTCGRIIRDIITPQFRNGNFNQGVIDGVSAMIAAVRGEFNEQSVNHGKQPDGNMEGMVIFLLFILFNMGRILGRHKLLSTGIGAIIVPVIGSLFLGFQWLIFLTLIPVGSLAGYLASLIFGSSGSSTRRARGQSGSFRGYSSGSFGGGGFGGGGGGGFGGGGASGGW